MIWKIKGKDAEDPHFFFVWEEKLDFCTEKQGKPALLLVLGTVMIRPKQAENMRKTPVITCYFVS